jgi:hypothetical protein
VNETDTQDLPYPEINDPANGALQLQLLAEAIDAKLVTQFALYRGIVNRSTFIAGLTGTQSYSSGLSTLSWDTFLYNSADTSSVGSDITIYETGYWMVGAFLQTNPAGGITANSTCNAFLLWNADLVLPLGDTLNEQWVKANFQSSTGGEHQTVTGIVRQEYDGTANHDGGGRLSLALFHANVASNVVVQTTSLLWAFKICELEDM